MERNMTVIKPNPFLLSNPFSIRKKRVVAYARVSTSSKEQLHSFKAQKEYYENYISKHKDYISIQVNTNK